MRTVLALLLSPLLDAAVLAQEPREPVSFEMRPVAVRGPRIDLKAERKRLEGWLDRDGNREMVRRFPLAAHLYNWTPRDQGGPETTALRWYPRVIRPTGEIWDYSLAMRQGVEALAVFDRTEHSRKPGDDPQFLVELVPVDVGDEYFHGGDLQWARPGIDAAGSPAVDYLLRPDRAGGFANWTERLKGYHVAMIVDGAALSAPRIIDRIPGRCQLSALRGKEIAEAMARGFDRMARASADGSSRISRRILEGQESDPEGLLLVAQLLVADARPSVRREAAMALRQHGDHAKWFLPALLRSLQDERDPKVLAEVVTTTAILGDTAKHAVPLLERLLQHDDEQVSQRAKAALRQVGGGR